MQTIDHDDLALLMDEMVDDQSLVIAFVAAYGEALAGTVRYHLVSLSRRDLAADPDEVQGLVWDVALFLQERAGAWQPGGALPWNWASRGIADLVSRAIGHARANVEIEVLDLAPAPSSLGAWDEVNLRDLVDDPTVALLVRALDQIVGSPRDRQVHIEYRRQAASGDMSPAHTVGAMFGLRPDHVRQIDRRVRMRLSDLALADATYGALIGLPWLTAGRAPMGHSPVPEMAA